MAGTVEPHAKDHALRKAAVESDVPSGLAPKLTTLMKVAFEDLKNKKMARKSKVNWFVVLAILAIFKR